MGKNSKLENDIFILMTLWQLKSEYKSELSPLKKLQKYDLYRRMVSEYENVQAILENKKGIY